VAAPPQNAADAARQRIADPRLKQLGRWSNIEATETAMWRLRKRINDPNHWFEGGAFGCKKAVDRKAKLP